MVGVISQISVQKIYSMGSKEKTGVGAEPYSYNLRNLIAQLMLSQILYWIRLVQRYFCS